jgi:hypothetical protein
VFVDGKGIGEISDAETPITCTDVSICSITSSIELPLTAPTRAGDVLSAAEHPRGGVGTRERIARLHRTRFPSQNTTPTRQKTRADTTILFAACSQYGKRSVFTLRSR